MTDTDHDTGTHGGVLEVLRSVEVPTGVTKGDWQAACDGITKGEFLQAMATLVKSGVVVNINDGSGRAERYVTAELAATRNGDTEADVVDNFDDITEEDGCEVLDDVVDYLDRYVAWTNDECRDAVALWIAHTYVFDCFDITPRLAVLSPLRECGKTRVMELVKFLARNARLTVSMSEAYMFRIIEAQAPTLLIDEADTIFGSRRKNDANEGLRGLLNAGWERGASVGRMVGDGANMQPKDFAVFAPAALAGIGNFLPDTVRDRSVVIRMQRRTRDQKVEPLRQRRAKKRATLIARRLAAWGHRHRDVLADTDPEMPEGVDDRPADVWMSLLAVAEVAGGDWPERAAAACLRLIGSSDYDDASLSVMLLGDIREIFAKYPSRIKPDAMFSKTLVDHLNRIEERPWLAWTRGDGINATDLARLLRDFGIKSKNVRIGRDQFKGYELAQFHDAFDRYLEPDPEFAVALPLTYEETSQRPKSGSNAQEPASEAVS